MWIVVDPYIDDRIQWLANLGAVLGTMFGVSMLYRWWYVRKHGIQNTPV